MQAMFVDRIVLAHFVASGITVLGEAILPLVPVAPIRRFDVFKVRFRQACIAGPAIADEVQSSMNSEPL
jgi:hypothetical protein